MELKHLRTFLAVNQYSSFTRAARSLGVTQAAVSQQIAALEGELGAVLFERGSRHVQLAAGGEQLLDHAQQIVRLADEAVASFQPAGPPLAGVLRIAASTVPAQTLLPNLLADFQRRHPQVSSEVAVSDSRLATASVARGEADLGLVGRQPAKKNLVHRALADDELVLIVGANHPLAARKAISLKQLAAMPLIVREEDSGSRACLEAALAEFDLALDDMQIAMQVNSNDAIVAAVRRGSGAAFLSAATLQEEIDAGHVSVLKVRKLRPRRQLYLIHPRGGDGKEPLRSFLDFIREATP